MFWNVICCKKLIYLPAHNNLKIFFPIIFILSRLFRVEIYYLVVGGWLREFLKNLPIHRYMLKRIRGIYAETKRLKKELEEYYDFKNVSIFLTLDSLISILQLQNRINLGSYLWLG